MSVVVRADVDAVLAGIFDINAKVARMTEDVTAIRRLLEEDDDEAEEEDQP